MRPEPTEVRERRGGEEYLSVTYKNWQEWIGHPPFSEEEIRKNGYASSQSPHDHNTPHSWYSTATYEEAQKLAQTGWPEGRHRMEGISAHLRKVIGSRMEDVDWYYDYEGGGNLDVGRYVENEPECWMHPRTRIIAAQGRLVDLIFNGTPSSAINPKTIEVRGAAILALIEALEMHGHSVRLRWLWAVHSIGSNHNFHLRMWVPIKEWGMPLDRARLAFALLHPSMPRRIAFRAIEALAEGDYERLKFGYGVPESLEDTEYDAAKTVYVKELLYNHGAEYDDVEEQYTAFVLPILRDLAERGLELLPEGKVQYA